MSAGQLAALIAAGFFAVGMCAVVFVLLRLAGLISHANRIMTDYGDRAGTLIERAQAAVDRTNEQLERTDSITASMDEVTANVADLSGHVPDWPAWRGGHLAPASARRCCGSPRSSSASAGRYALRRPARPSAGMRPQLPDARGWSAAGKRVPGCARPGQAAPPGGSGRSADAPGLGLRPRAGMAAAGGTAMIRRLFWLIAGVLLGVTGYRRVSRLARAVAPGGPRRQARRGTGAASPAGSWAAARRCSPATCARAWSCIRIVIPGWQAVPSKVSRHAAHPAAAGSAAPCAPRHRQCEGWPLMESAEIARRFLNFFSRARAHRRPLGQPDRRRPHAAAGQRRHGPVQAVFPRPAGAAVPPGHQRAEVRAHGGHRGSRQDHPARELLPDAGELLVRRLLQGAGHPVRLGAAHQRRSPTAGSASPRTGSG